MVILNYIFPIGELITTAITDAIASSIIDPTNIINPMSFLAPFIYYFSRITDTDVEDVKNWTVFDLTDLIATVANDDVWLDVSEDIMKNWSDFASINSKILALFTYLGLNYAGDALTFATNFMTDLKEYHNNNKFLLKRIVETSTASQTPFHLSSNTSTNDELKKLQVHTSGALINNTTTNTLQVDYDDNKIKFLNNKLTYTNPLDHLITPMNIEQYVENNLYQYRNVAGNTGYINISGNVSIGTPYKITQETAPTVNSDVVNKLYVDNKVSGLGWTTRY